MADEIAILRAGAIVARGPPTLVPTGALLREVYGVDLDVVAVDMRRLFAPRIERGRTPV